MSQLTEEQRVFLAEPHFAVVATIAPDGMPHQTVMWYALNDDGSLLLNTPNGSRKHRLLQEDPRISVCVEQGYRYVTLIGRVTLDENPESAGADYARIGAHYMGDGGPPRPANPPKKRPKLLDRARVSLHMTVEQVISNGF